MKVFDGSLNLSLIHLRAPPHISFHFHFQFTSSKHKRKTCNSSIISSFLCVYVCVEMDGWMDGLSKGVTSVFRLEVEGRRGEWSGVNESSQVKARGFH